MLDRRAGWYERSYAAQVLATVDADGIVSDLLRLFFSETEKDALWATALTLESLRSSAAVSPLVQALGDDNPHRRHAAARALGWTGKARRTAAAALVDAVLDKSQPQQVREEAAESLAYLGCAGAVPALISVLDEPEVRMRFWAVFALGSLGRTLAPQHHGRIVQALERMMRDEVVPPGNWWSVRLEALAMLGALTPHHRQILQAEIDAVLSDREASPEDRRWAECYSTQALAWQPL